MVDHTARDHEVVSSMLGFLRLLSFFYFFPSSKVCLNKVPETISDMKAVWKRIPSYLEWNRISLHWKFSLFQFARRYFKAGHCHFGISRSAGDQALQFAALPCSYPASIPCRHCAKAGILTGFNRCFWQLSLTAEGTHCNCKFMQHYKDFVRKKTSLVTF